MRLHVKYTLLIIIIAIIFPLSINSQSTFMKTYGYYGKDHEDIGYSVLQTEDGGYVISHSRNSPENQSNYVCLTKLDDSLNIQWEKNYPPPTLTGFESSSDGTGYDVIQTSDGGYITTGQSRYGSSGDPDLFLIKGNKEGILVSVKDEEEIIPTNIELEQNYPNPFNPTTTINYTIPKGGNVRLEIYNPLGEIVNILKDSYEDAGAHTISWNGNDSSGNSLSSGIYFYRLVNNDFV